MKIISAVQPTNKLTLGNYLGAIRNFNEKSSIEDNRFFFIADYHALTLGIVPELRKNILMTLATYLASGLSPNVNTIFLQSHVSAHAEMKQILSYFTTMGKLQTQAQYKDKSESRKSIPLSLFDYPVLMAGDILLYDIDKVPVGRDQAQHLELTRELAYSLNSQLGLTLKIPEAIIDQSASKIMSLQNPHKKMSKSDPDQLATIFLTDSADTIIKKFKKAVTDSGSEIIYSNDSQGVKNLIDLQIAILKKPAKEIIESYTGKKYGHLKQETADIVIDYLKPIQDSIKTHLENEDYLLSILKDGKEKAEKEANYTLSKIKSSMGFL